MQEAQKNNGAVVRATVGVSPDILRKVRHLAADRASSAYQVMSDAVIEVAEREFAKLGIK